IIDSPPRSSTRPRHDALPTSDRAPSSTPTTSETQPTSTMTVMDCWVPRITWANTSLPRVSCPNGCSPRLNGHSVSVGRPLLTIRSEEHTSELQSRENLVCHLL